MANLSIRKLDDETVARLRRQAREHGVSMEEEARQILKHAVDVSEPLGELAVRLFRSSYGIKPFEPPAREHSDPLKIR